MRVKPVIGQTAWFGPRRAGWGWSPVTWQGWLLTVAVLVAILAGVVTQGPALLALDIALVPVLLVVGALKGTSPGGPTAWRVFQQIRAGELGDVAVDRTPADVRKTRIVVGVGGAVIAAMIALMMLGSIGAFAISPPTSVRVRDGRLAVDVRGPYVVFAMRSGISVPLSSILSASFEPEARYLPRGTRIGTYIPGGLIAGRFRLGPAQSFWALQHRGALVIILTGERFAELVIEVRHPSDVLDQLAAAGVPTTPGRH